MIKAFVLFSEASNFTTAGHETAGIANIASSTGGSISTEAKQGTPCTSVSLGLTA
ncbi:unknown [Tannerella sp. CAG:118]|nr:unknown [Tannerella sp. CAG:118]